jgi:hypothetical protein
MNILIHIFKTIKYLSVCLPAHHVSPKRHVVEKKKSNIKDIPLGEKPGAIFNFAITGLGSNPSQ